MTIKKTPLCPPENTPKRMGILAGIGLPHYPLEGFRRGLFRNPW
jgi:hypothetical protein